MNQFYYNIRVIYMKRKYRRKTLRKTRRKIRKYRRRTAIKGGCFKKLFGRSSSRSRSRSSSAINPAPQESSYETRARRDRTFIRSGKGSKQAQTAMLAYEKKKRDQEETKSDYTPISQRPRSF